MSRFWRCTNIVGAKRCPSCGRRNGGEFPGADATGTVWSAVASGSGVSEELRVAAVSNGGVVRGSVLDPDQCGDVGDGSATRYLSRRTRCMSPLKTAHPVGYHWQEPATLNHPAPWGCKSRTAQSEALPGLHGRVSQSRQGFTNNQQSGYRPGRSCQDSDQCHLASPGRYKSGVLCDGTPTTKILLEDPARSGSLLALVRAASHSRRREHPPHRLPGGVGRAFPWVCRSRRGTASQTESKD